MKVFGYWHAGKGKGAVAQQVSIPSGDRHSAGVNEDQAKLNGNTAKASAMRAMHDSSSSWTDGCLPHGAKAPHKQQNALIGSESSCAEGRQEDMSKPACQEMIKSDAAFEVQGAAPSVVDPAETTKAAVMVNPQSLVLSNGEQGMHWGLNLLQLISPEG